ncbi:hypothetical protein KUA24_90 [Vibrio phage HNL01]|nr:hypothetical protein KUA24_90 [Vibrio phage HNL01]
MSNLDKYQELTDINFDGENPHSAICHHSQGFSANGCHTALMFKAEKQPVSSELIKSLEGALPQTEIEKMSFNNKRRALEVALADIMEGADSWSYVEDFSEDMIVFVYDSKTYVVSYTMDEAGVVEFGQEPVEAKRKDLYVDSETGEELVKAADWFKEEIPTESPEKVSSEEDGVVQGEGQETDSQITPDETLETQEEIMSQEQKEVVVEKGAMDIAEIMKSAEAQELIKAAIQADRDAREAAELEKSTVEIVKGYEVVAEEDAAALTKAILVSEESAMLLKALGDFQIELEKAKAEVAEVKKEFGEKQESVESTPVLEKSNKSRAELKAQVAQYKAAKAAK